MFHKSIRHPVAPEFTQFNEAKLHKYCSRQCKIRQDRELGEQQHSAAGAAKTDRTLCPHRRHSKYAHKHSYTNTV